MVLKGIKRNTIESIFKRKIHIKVTFFYSLKTNFTLKYKGRKEILQFENKFDFCCFFIN